MDHLLSERAGHVVTITMNRPDRLNAISGPMLQEMSRLLVECDADRDVRAVVLTGAGRGFCSAPAWMTRHRSSCGAWTSR